MGCSWGSSSDLRGGALPIKTLFVLTCFWPRPLHPVASKRMTNQPFHVLRDVGLQSRSPPPGSQPSRVSRDDPSTPHCVLRCPHRPPSAPPPPQYRLPSVPHSSLDHTRPNKLMSQSSTEPLDVIPQSLTVNTRSHLEDLYPAQMHTPLGTRQRSSVPRRHQAPTYFQSTTVHLQTCMYAQQQAEGWG